jgi:hypothetical protein
MIVTGTIPSSFETALREYAGLSRDFPAGLWSVWALSTADLARGSRAAVLAGYQFAVPALELSSTPEAAAFSDAQVPETQSDTSADEASSRAQETVVTPPMVLELPVRPGAGVQKMTGALAEAILMAEHQIRNTAEAESAEMIWELRALHVPALYLQALWLHSLSGRPDLVVPYTSGTNKVEAFHPQPLRRMLQGAAGTPRPVWPEE